MPNLALVDLGIRNAKCDCKEALTTCVRTLLVFFTPAYAVVFMQHGSQAESAPLQICMFQSLCVSDFPFVFSIYHSSCLLKKFKKKINVILQNAGR